MTINERQDEIIDEFSGFDDWMDKYQLLIDLGNEQPLLDEGWDVIVFIPSKEEDEDRITCGNALLATEMSE